MLIIGRVQKPHGIKGIVKAQSFMDSPYELAKLKTVEIEGMEYEIDEITVSNKSVLIKFKGVDTIEDAFNLRNKELKIKRESAPKPPEGRYYISDLLGSEVYVGDKFKGNLIDIMQYGSADVYRIKGEKTFMFPFTGDVIEKIDIASKKIYLNLEELEKVAVYED
ncbi:MAG: ribosome maturation factor RimM [Bacillota bacterium]